MGHLLIYNHIRLYILYIINKLFKLKPKSRTINEFKKYCRKLYIYILSLVIEFYRENREILIVFNRTDSPLFVYIFLFFNNCFLNSNWTLPFQFFFIKIKNNIYINKS